MQKWCPEPFDVTVPAVPAAPPAATGFEAATDAAPQALFRSESGFVDRETLMASLTQSERAQLFELVEIEVGQIYAEKEAALRAEHQAQMDQTRASYDTDLRELGSAVDNTLTTLHSDLARACARLAVQLAGKVVRDTVKIDPEVLTRNLETTLFKIHGSNPVTIEVNPADAERLAAHPELLEKLQVSTVSRDRRIEAGGCIVHSGSHTWDATLESQLETLGEVVAEMIATADPAPLSDTPETPHEPGLD